MRLLVEVNSSIFRRKLLMSENRNFPTRPCLIVFFLFLLAFLQVSISFAGHTGTGDMHSGDPLNDVSPNTESPPCESTPEAEQNPLKGAEPVYLHNGEFAYSHQDLFVPGRGLDLDISRTYRSQREFNGQFGFGWFFDFYTRLKKLSNGNMLLVDGSRGRKNEFTYSSNDTYSAPAGVYDSLVKNDDGTYSLIKKNGTRFNFDINGCLVEIVDRNSNTLSFSYTPTKCAIISKSLYFVVSLEGVVAYDYQLVKITDTVGREILLDYDVKGKLQKITDFTGREVGYSYDANGNLIKVTDPLQNTIQYTYDDSHNLLSIIDANGATYLVNEYDNRDKVFRQTYGSGVFLFEYDEAGSKTTLTDRKGYRTAWTYNADGNLVKKELFTTGLRPDEPDSYVTIYEYNGDMESTKIVLPRGNSREYTYDSKGNLLLEIRKPHPDTVPLPANIVTSFTYEPNYNFIKTITDPKGNVTTYDYELDQAHPKYGASGNLIYIEQPMVGKSRPTTEFTCNTHGQITEIKDPNLNTIRYTYYAATGYLEKVIQDPAGVNATTLMTYDQLGNIVSTIDANGHTTTYTCDNDNRLIEQINPSGYKTKYSYDNNGNIILIKRQANEEATQWQNSAMTYTLLNQVKTVTDSLNRVTTFSYDLNQNQISILDAKGNTTSREYDERNLLYKVIDASTPNRITTYDYDENDNLSRIFDPNNTATVYLHDDFDRLIKTVYADGSFSRNMHDLNSNIITFTTPGSQTINYSYDDLNRRTAVSFPDTPALNSTYEYDAGSRLISAANSAAVISHSYDSLNRLQRATQTLNATAYTIGYSYDSASNPAQLVYPSGKTVDHLYDASDRLTSLKVNGALMTIAMIRWTDALRGTTMPQIRCVPTISMIPVIS